MPYKGLSSDQAIAPLKSFKRDILTKWFWSWLTGHPFAFWQVSEGILFLSDWSKLNNWKFYLFKISTSLCINRPLPAVYNFTSERVSCLGEYLPTGISFHHDFFMVFSCSIHILVLPWQSILCKPFRHIENNCFIYVNCISYVSKSSYTYSGSSLE